MTLLSFCKVLFQGGTLVATFLKWNQVLDVNIVAPGKWIPLQCVWDLLGEFDYGLCFPSACRFIPWMKHLRFLESLLRNFIPSLETFANITIGSLDHIVETHRTGTLRIINVPFQASPHSWSCLLKGKKRSIWPLVAHCILGDPYRDRWDSRNRLSRLGN